MVIASLSVAMILAVFSAGDELTSSPTLNRENNDDSLVPTTEVPSTMPTMTD